MRLPFGLTAVLGVAMLTPAVARAAVPSGWTVPEGPAPSVDADGPARPVAQQNVAPVIREPMVIPLRELPEIAVPEAGPVSKEQGPTYFDTFGRPVTQLDRSPRGGEIYIVPPGGGGRITVGDADTFWGNDEPFFRSPTERGRGFGVHFPWNARIPRQLAIFWHGIEATGGALRFRSVKGTLDRFEGTVVAAEQIDTSLRPFAGGLVQAFVSRRDGNRTLHVVVPTGSVAYASPDAGAVSAGTGFFFGGRAPFTELRLPLRPVGATTVGIDVSRFSMARYRAAGASMEGLFDGRIHVSVSGGDEPRLILAMTGTS